MTRIRVREEIVIDRPLDQMLAAVEATPLAEAIVRDSPLPGVRGTYVLAGGKFDQPGSRHP